MLRRQGALCRLATTKTNRGYSTLTNVCIAQRRSRDRVWVAHSALPGAATRLLTVTVPNDDTGGTLEAQVKVGAESQVVKVSIKKPLGFVLAERAGRVVVESVTAGGHAEVSGVAPGDVLLAVGARAQKGGGSGLAPGVPVLLATAGESFSTVTAAIRSNTCSQCLVHLVLERPAPHNA